MFAGAVSSFANSFVVGRTITCIPLSLLGLCRVSARARIYIADRILGSSSLRCAHAFEGEVWNEVGVSSRSEIRQMVAQAVEALQNSWLIVTLNGTDWTAAALEIVHYFSMFVLVGSVAIVDLRIMGLAGQEQSASKLARRLFPWMWAALAFNFLSGFLMFAGLATSYIPDPTFHHKMEVTFAAVIFGIIVQWKVAAWDKSPSMPLAAKVVAAISLLLWIGAILAGVEVPAVSGIG